jgi:hypothetical protein
MGSGDRPGHWTMIPPRDCMRRTGVRALLARCCVNVFSWEATVSQVKLLRVVVQVLAAAYVCACGDEDDEFEADLSAVAEIPAPAGLPTARGTADMELDERELEIEINVEGQLTSAVTMAHIHGPATVSETAPIIFDFAPYMGGVIQGGARTGTMVNTRVDLDALPVSATGVLRVDPDSLITWLSDGRAYINVHTVLNPSGELRGQVRRDD